MKRFFDVFGIPQFFSPFCSVSSGEEGAAGGGGDDAATPSAFAAGLPEDLRANAAFQDIPDTATLARRYADTQRPLAERLPEDLRNEAAFRDIKDVGELAKSYLNAQRMVGLDKNRLVVLPKDANDGEGFDALYKALGRPDSPDQYAIPAQPDGKAYTDEDVAFQKAILPALHAAGVSQAQLEKIVPAWNSLAGEIAGKQSEKLEAGAKEAEASLRKDWGAQYEENLNRAVEAVRYYSGELKLGDAVLSELNASNLGNSPALAKMLSHLGGQLKEDGVLGKATEGAGGRMTPEAAKSAIVEKEKAFYANAEFKNKNAPGRQAALDELKMLYGIAYPSA